jgi:hypothetical protein
MAIIAGNHHGIPIKREWCPGGELEIPVVLVETDWGWGAGPDCNQEVPVRHIAAAEFAGNYKHVAGRDWKTEPHGAECGRNKDENTSLKVNIPSNKV